MAINDNHQGKGLASASDDTRQRVAQAGGNAVSQDTQHMSQIGKKGGQAAQASGNAHQLTDEERSKGGQSAQQSGHAHQLTDEERSRGGQIGGSR